MICEKIQSWAWMLLLQSVLVQISGSGQAVLWPVPATWEEFCCLVGLKVCPAAFNLRATLGINVVSSFFVPSFTLPSPGQRWGCHPPTTTLTVVSSSTPMPLQLGTPSPVSQKKEGRCCSLHLRPAGEAVCHAQLNPVLLLPWEPGTSGCIHRGFVTSTSFCWELPEIQHDHHCGCWSGFRSGNYEATTMKLSSWNWRQLSLDLYPLQAGHGREGFSLTSEFQTDARLGVGFKPVAVNVWLYFNCFQLM